MTILAPATRTLTTADTRALAGLLERDPIAHCLVAGRVASAGDDITRTGCDAWGYIVDDKIASALFIGANIVPIETTPAARAAFAQRLRLTGRRSSSMVGRAEEVIDLWRLLEPGWGRAREVRDCQPLLVIEGEPHVAPDPQVRPVRPDELDLLLPASIAMFTEEVGVSPVSGGMYSAYRGRVAELIGAERAFARIENGRVVFKAEVGAATTDACQVQGVWVDPQFRGRGLSAAGMAAVVQWAQRTIAPRVSLYVNDFNLAARRCYERVGFEQQGTFATVLF